MTLLKSFPDVWQQDMHHLPDIRIPILHTPSRIQLLIVTKNDNISTTIPLGSNLGKLYTHIASPISQLQETGVQKGSFRRLSGYGD